MAQVLSLGPTWLKLKPRLLRIFGWIARNATISNFFALIWILVAVTVIVLIVQDLARNVVTIGPISVPKDLADSGYTQEVASHRLRDALRQYEGVNWEGSPTELSLAYLTSINIQARDELPDFVVPQIGLSLGAIVASIRSVLHYRSGQAISGELIFHDKFALRVRVDNRIVFDSKYDSADPDDLLTRAAPAVLDQIQPYLSAKAEARDHPDQALQKAEDIIASREESDPNVQGAFVLKGDYWLRRGDFAQAEAMYRKAISLNWNVAEPHNQLGVMLQHQGKLDLALTQFRRVVNIDPKSAIGYNNIGWVLASTGKPGSRLDAMRYYRRAIAINPHYALAHSNLGSALSDDEQIDAAIDEYRVAIQFDEKDVRGHLSLANALIKKHDYDGALLEYRAATDTTEVPRNLAILHTWIGDILELKADAGGKRDEVIAEYNRAIEIDPSYTWSHNNLALIWRDQGKLDDAIAEFHAAIQADPKNDTAKENLAHATQAIQAEAPKQASAADAKEASPAAAK